MTKGIVLAICMVIGFIVSLITCEWYGLVIFIASFYLGYATGVLETKDKLWDEISFKKKGQDQ